ncbi:MAG: MATE family efflux transporter [Bacteroidales bacterium]|nr:MATE family efflux transporter [Bacteroidales bacterium]
MAVITGDITRIMNKRILDLAVPNIISNILVPLLGIVDMILMGHMGTDSYVGAVALGSLIFNFIYWGFGFLRMGTTGFTAQARGRRDLPETIHVLGRALLISVSAGIILILTRGPVEWLAFTLLDGEADVETLAASYFRIRIWAAPAALSQFALMGWFIGMQNARIPMVISIVVNLVNIGCNYFLVVVAGYDSDGVAAGTVVAQYTGLLLSLWFFRRYFSRLLKYVNREALIRLSSLNQFMSVNRDIFIRTMCLVLVFSFFTAQSASADRIAGGDETTLAVNSLLMQFFMFFSYLIDGFAYAAEAMTGRFIGAGSRRNLMRAIRLLFIWGAVISIVFTLIYLTAGEYIFRLLTSIPSVIENARPYFIWIILVPLISFTAFLWDGIFIGATAGKEMRNSMILATALVFFPAWLVLEQLMGNHGLWLAFILYMAARGVTMTLLARTAVYNKV